MSKIVSAELIQNLEKIARIKESLPKRSRGWCNELGLFVQMREAAGMARLQAGGKFRSKIDLWRDSPTESWQVKKYRPGDWEELAEPTLKLAKWLAPRGGLANTVENDFQYAINTFRYTGSLNLPQGIESFRPESALGCIVNMYAGGSQTLDDSVWQDARESIERYIRENPDHAAGWHALSRAYELQGRFGDSLDALDRAISVID